MTWKYSWNTLPPTDWKIILHHSLTKDSNTVSWEAIRRYHVETLGWADVGYHFCIELIGNKYQILTGRPLGTVGAHTSGYNNNSIGICCVGNYDQNKVPELMYITGINLIIGLCKTLHINPKNIYGHRDFSYKTCPGTLFDIDKIKLSVKNRLI